jgi:hypothetical protein
MTVNRNINWIASLRAKMSANKNTEGNTTTARQTRPRPAGPIGLKHWSGLANSKPALAPRANLPKQKDAQPFVLKCENTTLGLLHQRLALRDTDGALARGISFGKKVAGCDFDIRKVSFDENHLAVATARNKKLNPYEMKLTGREKILVQEYMETRVNELGKYKLTGRAGNNCRNFAKFQFETIKVAIESAREKGVDPEFENMLIE